MGCERERERGAGAGRPPATRGTAGIKHHFWHLWYVVIVSGQQRWLGYLRFKS